jgi:RNA polymerase sigma-70 factor (ECF subfamily)
MDTRSDTQLVSACQEGDRHAFAALVQRHTRRIFAICYAILDNIHDAEDAVQDVFFRCLTQIGRLREGEHFAAWISQIARNRCRDRLREQTRRKALLEEHAGSIAGTPDFTRLHDALNSLSENERVPLMLFYFDGRSAQSVAESLNLSPAGACTRLSRARRKLRVLLEQGGEMQ